MEKIPAKIRNLYVDLLKTILYPSENILSALKTKYTPTVLSRKEIDTIINHLKDPFALFVKLLYGCGMGLNEVFNLRVQDFDFNDGKLTVSDTGRKFRKVVLPGKIIPELQQQLEKV